MSSDLSYTPKYPVQPGLVSVIVPTFNRPERLKECLQSILHQTYQNFEILIINDCGEVLNFDPLSLDSKNRIASLRNEKNLGLAGTRNVGLQHAKGEFIAYLDDDDRFYPEHLETLISVLTNTPFQVAYTDAHRAWEELRGGAHVVVKRDRPYSVDFNEDILCTNFIPVLCVMHRRACLSRSGHFDAYLKRTEDWDLWARMSRDFPFAHIPKITCEFSWRSDGTSMTSSTRDSFDWAELNIYYKYVNNPTVPASRANQIKEQTKQAVARLLLSFKQDDRHTGDEYKRLLGGSISELLQRIKFLAPHYQAFCPEIFKLGCLIHLSGQQQIIDRELLLLAQQHLPHDTELKEISGKRSTVADL
jgi:glycosyltransferase involved in cell wall biosynthesis